MPNHASQLSASVEPPPVLVPMNPVWTLIVPRLPGYVHVAALQELFDAVFHGLRQLGQTVRLGDQWSVPENAILIGAHLMSPEQCNAVPNGTIVYNSEHASSGWMAGHYRTLLSRVMVWDYSLDNTRMLASLIGHHVQYMPLGYVPEFTRIKPLATEDIDVLFYGSYTDRRGTVFDAIRSRGLTFHHAFGVYGTERDALIARAKVVLNVHAYVPGAFEVVRIAYLLANRKAVVSEVNPGERIDADLDGAFVAAPYENIVSTVEELVANAPAREAVAMAGYDRFCQRHQADTLRHVLGPRIA